MNSIQFANCFFFETFIPEVIFVFHLFQTLVFQAFIRCLILPIRCGKKFLDILNIIINNIYTFVNIIRQEHFVRTMFPGAYSRIHLLCHCVVNGAVAYRMRKNNTHYSQTVLKLVRRCSYCPA